jgi:aspartyl-tRNA(Asn)/glutamyl-tRNA(Gln) amidotransferase subunit A
MTDETLMHMSATEMLERFRDRSLSPVETAKAALGRIDRFNGQVNAVCHVDEELTLAEARRSEERYRRGMATGLLDGVPVAVKDIFLVRDWPTRKGSDVIDPADNPDEESPAISSLRRHGFVPVGMTTTPELGWKAVTDNPRDGVTRNAWNPELTPGGSSGGTASAIALGMAPVGLGTDAGGSIRIPGGFTGVVGHKPTQGRVPFWPPSAFGDLAHPGPMAWTVEDAALLLQVMAESDGRNLAMPENQEDYGLTLAEGVQGLRVAYSADLGYAKVDPEIAALVADAARVFSDLGAQVDAVDPGFENPHDSFCRLFYGGAANAIRDKQADVRARMDPALIKVSEEAEKMSALDYLDALNTQRSLAEKMGRFHDRYDLLLTPTMPIPPFTAGKLVPEGWDEEGWPSWTPFTYPFNMTGQPACSVPCGFTGAGLPAGLQIVGARHQDALVLRAAFAYQAARPLTDRRPPMLDQ